ncbi:MAG: hypothetical protein ACI4SR_09635 [Faecalibacillus sp.]
MELIKNVLIIVGIFVFIYLGVMFFLKSEDSKKKNKIKIDNMRSSIEDVNMQLDDALEQLQNMNQPLEKAMSMVRKFNNHVFTKK